ncbi:MAG TPA: hypothetical protein ENI61_03250 [Ignavibacteria bacterium]|nr:hypothetical protein [Ignavibacteria bacterium]
MLHPKLDKYFAEIEKSIKRIKNCNVELYNEEILGYNRINLKIRVRFEEGSLFEISEAVISDEDQLKHLGYRYHFQNKENQLIFRYDNTPHYPNVETFPNHKHLPGKVIESVKPFLADVVNEIIVFME